MNKLILGNCLDVLPTLTVASVNCVITSPPYFGLRDYGMDEQIGLEQTPAEYVQKLVSVFRECWRVLRDDGTLWLNLGDSYNGSGKGPAGCTSQLGKVLEAQALNKRSNVDGLKSKDLIGIPWRVAFALQDDGWYLRSDIIWHKPNPMPESVTDRPTKSHEYIFLLTKSQKYYYDAEAILEPAQYGKEHANKSTSWGTERKHPNKNNVENYAFKGENHTTTKMLDGSYGRNKRTVWTVPTSPYKGAHFATFPADLVKPMVLAGCPVNGTVLDPFNGSGTTGEVAIGLGRNYIGIELNPEYIKLANRRLAQPGMSLA